MIILIGDSHTEAFYDKEMEPYFRKIHISLATAYNSFKHISYIEEHLRLFDIKKPTQGINYDVDKEKDYMFFCFGEIDIRCHLGFKSEENNTSPKKEILKCFSRYSETLEYFANKGYNIGIYGPIASGKSQRTADGYKSYKDYKARNFITNIFNRELINYCDKKGFKFKTLFYQMCDDPNYDSYFAEDQLHLNSGMFCRGKKNIDINSILIDLFYVKH